MKKSYYGYAHFYDDKKQLKKWKKQRKERGFDDTELWSLDHTIIKFIAPRIAAFNPSGYPDYMTSEKWDWKIEQMKRAFDYLENDYDVTHGFKTSPRFVRVGLENFVRHFTHLWD